MFKLLLYILFIFGNIYFDLYDYLKDFIINHSQFITNMLVIIFYAWLNEDSDFDFTDDNDFENDNLNEDIDDYIDNQHSKNKKK